MADDWHLVHLGSRAVGGVALVMVEATAVTRDGRITPGDMGIWDDRHVEPLARIARFVHGQGAVAGIQLAHAGRKASCDVPWKGGARLKTAAAGRLDGRRPQPDPVPTRATRSRCRSTSRDRRHRRRLRGRRAAGTQGRLPRHRDPLGPRLPAARVPLAADQPRGPTTTAAAWRTACGCSLQVAERLRRVMPDELPLFVRISATDWVEGGWDIEQSVVLARHLAHRGVDLIDVSCGRARAQGADPGRQGLPGAVRPADPRTRPGSERPRSA